MIIKTSGFVSDHLALLTLGHSCLYLICLDKHVVLVDPGLSAYFPFVQQRLQTISAITVSEITDILLTNLQPDRIAAVGLIKKLNPSVIVHGGFNMREKSLREDHLSQLVLHDHHLSQNIVKAETIGFPAEQFSAWHIDHFIKDGEIVISDSAGDIRGFSFPAHSHESWCYLLTPEHFLIADQGLGYYQGRELAAPGADHNLQLSIPSLKQFTEMNISGIALPCFGVLTGALAHDYLNQLIINSNDLIEQVQLAFADNFPQQHIYQSIKDAFYSEKTGDRLVRYKMAHSMEAIWKQLLQLMQPTSST